MSIKALQGDCLEVMKTLPDKSIDLFICDLPYGCLTGGAGTEKKKRQLKRFVDGVETDNTAVYNGGVIAGCSWDIKIDLDKFWEQVERLMKNDHTPIIQFCNTRFGNELINSKPKWFRYDLVWSKKIGVGFLCANKQPLRSHENIYIFAKKGANYNRIDIEGDFKRWNVTATRTGNVYGNGMEKTNTGEDSEGKRCIKSVIEVSNKKAKGQHPTAKPIDLYKFLIERYSNQGDVVLDATFGSGNSGRASLELNRNYIGIEKDEVFFNKFVSSCKTQE
jgi:site-specific DNA-methyltransferase (adenine-specific)